MMDDALRFDDTLETVLAADLQTPSGVQSAWRQLVDLVGRRRIDADPRALAALRSLRPHVPEQVRQASARALEFADPPAPLVRLLVTDTLGVALPILRSARITSPEWIELLPELAPAARNALRNRRDLGPAVRRALDSFGSVDFVLADQRTPETASDSAEAGVTPEADVAPKRRFGDMAAEACGAFLAADSVPILADTAEIGCGRDLPNGEKSLSNPPPPHSPTDAQPFLATGAGQAVQAKAREARPAGEPAAPEPVAGRGTPDGIGPFEIADVVARIDAFWRERSRDEAAVRTVRVPPRAHELRFETDAAGVVRWVEGVSRAPMIGLSFDLQGMPGGSRVDGIASGAFSRRAGFTNARMTIEGESDAAGDWLISAIPVFDSVNGRFSGYRGTGRRPRVDERAEPSRTGRRIEADSLRQLVHELRTPTNAIAGFAEMIETQMLGPVAEPYRERAAIIRTQTRELMGAIDDLDLAARIETAALTLVPGRIALRPLVAGIASDLAQLSELRGSMIVLPEEDLAVTGDHRAVERLLARLLATLVSASVSGEYIRVQLGLESERMVTVTIDRPGALADYPGDSLLGIDDEDEDATLLGTGFALRLARNLARELGGGLIIAPDSLSLRLPAAIKGQVGQAHLN